EAVLSTLPGPLLATGPCGPGDGDLDLEGPTAAASRSMSGGILSDGPTFHEDAGLLAQFAGSGDVAIDVTGLRTLAPSYGLCTGEFYGGAFNPLTGQPARI